MALVVLAAVQLLCVAGTASAVVLEAPPESAPAGLADGRVYEQVSPVAKNGNQAGAGNRGANAYGVTSPDGSRILYWNTGPIGEASSGVDYFSVSTRSPTGWSTKAALPQPAPEPRDPISGNDPIWLMPSGDLSSVVFVARNPFAPVSLNFADPEFEFASTYLSVEGEPAKWIGEPTVNPYPALEQVEDPFDLFLVGAAANLNVIYFQYYGTLVHEDAPRQPAVEGGSTGVPGLYEWREGHLKAAGLLPSGESGGEKEDEYGASVAGIGLQPLSARPSDFDNEVSQSGNTLLFVSPSPESESGLPPQLYARLNGSRTVLVSESHLTGEPSIDGVDAISGASSSHLSSYAYGSPDGSRVFFAAEEQLTPGAPPPEGLPEEYEFNLVTGTLTYLPGVTPPIIGSSANGSTFAFLDSSAPETKLAIYSKGEVTDIATLPKPAPMPGEHEGHLYLAPLRFSADAKTLTFQTDAPIPGFNDGQGYGEVYRYELSTDKLGCVSCPPHGQLPIGTADLSNDDQPQEKFMTVDSRGISENGSEIFFDTPDKLVSQDTNEVRDVYEWQDGKVSLISSGAVSEESFFLDNSASGSDVFFATNADLSGSDTDGSFDVYDARVGGGFPAPSSSSSCSTGCRTGTVPTLPPPGLASTALLGGGEQVPAASHRSQQTRPPLTRAQKLTRALNACKRKKGRSRHGCEALARRRYGKHPPRKRK